MENTVRDRSISAGDTEFLGGSEGSGFSEVMKNPRVTMVVSEGNMV